MSAKKRVETFVIVRGGGCYCDLHYTGGGIGELGRDEVVGDRSTKFVRCGHGSVARKATAADHAEALGLCPDVMEWCADAADEKVDRSECGARLRKAASLVRASENGSAE